MGPLAIAKIMDLYFLPRLSFSLRFDQIWEPSDKDNPSVDIKDTTISSKPDFNQVYRSRIILG